MLKIKVTSIGKDHSIPDNYDYLNVSFDIFEEDEEGIATVLEKRRLSFPLTATTKEIKAELKGYLKTYKEDTGRAEANKESEKVQKNADKVIEEMADVTI